MDQDTLKNRGEKDANTNNIIFTHLGITPFLNKGLHRVYHILGLNVCEYSPLLCGYHSLGKTVERLVESPVQGK